MTNTAWSMLHARRAPMILALAVLAAGIFIPTLTYPLVYDDLAIIDRNPVVTVPGGWLRVFTTPYWPANESLDPLYRPLTTLSFKLNHALFGPAAMSFRAVNLGLHALVTVLVAALAGRLWSREPSVTLPNPPLTRDRSLAAAWAAGLLFATHPIHAETLGLVVGRAELLAAFFVCWMLLRRLKNGQTAPSSLITHHSSIIPHISMALLFLTALCSKEHAVVAWPAIILLDAWYGWRGAASRGWRAYVARTLGSHHLGLILALATFLLARWMLFGGRTTLPVELVNPFANPLRNAPLATQLAAPPALLWLILRQWFAASPLCPIWSVGGFDPPDTLLRGDALAGAIFAVALMLGVVVGWKRAGRLSLVLGMFALAVLLPCHFIPAVNWLYAERWAYLPSVFLALACAGLAAWAPRITICGAVATAASFLAISLPYERSWRDQEALFRSATERRPYNYHGLVGFLSGLERQDRLSEAGAQVERLVARFPKAERAWYFKILHSAAIQDWVQAEEALRRWAELRPLAAPPPRVQGILEQLRQRGRGAGIEL